MFKFLMISSLTALSLSVGHAAENNLFIENYPPYTPPKVVKPAVKKESAPKPQVVTATASEETSQFTNYHQYDYWEVGQEEEDSSEVVNGTAQVTKPAVVLPAVVPKPKPRPELKPAVITEDKPSPEKQSTFDLNGCRYGRNCWSNKGLSQKIQKIVANVEYINSLHDSKIDPRYFLCTGWRESTFNPGALGAAGEKGMFQVMTATGRAALRYGPKVLPKDNYMTAMVNSTLAQTELSFLTLKMKVNEGASSRVLTGNGSIQDYWGLARRYNGAGPKAERYASKVTSCMSCMRTSFPNIHGAVNESKAKSCLNRAKGN